MLQAVQNVYMSRTKLTQDEFQRKCHEHDLTLAGACNLVFIRTDANINPKVIEKAFRTYGVLSEPMSGLFRLLFLMLDEGYYKDDREISG